MAQRTANTNTQNTNNGNVQDYAEMKISGTLDNVYVGKKKCYAEIHVYGENGYYTPFKVGFPLDYDFPNDGERISAVCEVKNYKGSITFTAKV